MNEDEDKLKNRWIGTITLIVACMPHVYATIDDMISCVDNAA